VSYWLITTRNFELKTWQKQKTGMKMQSKPIVALASGAVLLLGLLCQTAQAQSALLAVTGGPVNTGLTVGYSVADNSGVYTYTYTIADPPASVGTFSVDFPTAPPGEVVPGSITGSGEYEGISGATGTTVVWYVNIAAGGSGATLSFESLLPPALGNASATGEDSWGSSPGGEQVSVPQAIPEPATTTLLALSLLFLAFRPNMLKKA
jgi:hypothetical protein